MRSRAHLRVVPDLPEVQVRPLPAKWDGKPVTWGEWSSDLTTFVHHAPPEEWACQKCGGLHGHDAARGVIKGHSLTPRKLYAMRCRACGHDTVTEWDHSNEWRTWDLDESDYAPDGSWETGQGVLL
ncbi:hypothetical protein [Citricoccus sp. K5]|uniref:hypothetical protein n=1 Tax=Citricoccus sp. K5 TaxID=2653135 RepID=UPI0012F2BFA1|nr:hypothetical protein [Citricoccus sp. K5]VXA93191.1 conserved hypothetical protein [Citricoccus sp. K5]VXA95781.1 conserved hypothetical protein [Citricoccus sp. K5]